MFFIGDMEARRIAAALHMGTRMAESQASGEGTELSHEHDPDGCMVCALAKLSAMDAESKVRVQYAVDAGPEDAFTIPVKVFRIMLARILDMQFEERMLRAMARGVSPEDMATEESGDEDIPTVELGNLIDIVYRRAGDKATVIFADRLKDIGFEFATRAGISTSIKDMTSPPQK